jgi:hypothetical protein
MGPILSRNCLNFFFYLAWSQNLSPAYPSQRKSDNYFKYFAEFDFISKWIWDMNQQTGLVLMMKKTEIKILYKYTFNRLWYLYKYLLWIWIHNA